MRERASVGTYLRGAGLALKAGEKAEAAEFFLKGGEFETAALLFEKIGRYDRAAIAYESAGRPHEAADAFARAGEFRKAAELYADTGRHLEAAKMASEANDEKKMIGYLQKVRPGEPDYHEAVLVLARALTRRGWSSLAADTLETALGDEPVKMENLELWYALARAQEEQGELEEASSILQRIMGCQYEYREAESWQRRLCEELEARDETDPVFEGDRYIMEELLGRGGMGVVYRARDRLLERDVAYKMLPAALELLLREARAAAALNHPNIITIHDVGMDGDRAYIAMELIEGESYARILKRRGQLPVEDVMHFLVSVCQGLDHAHRRGVIHRDVKPSNVLLTSDDRVKIVDFGLAQNDTDASARVGGTLKYIAPEQARGEPTDARTDIYSLGATLYELISGSPPFTEGNLVRHHLETPVPPLAPERTDIPPSLEAIVMKCLSKEPSGRFGAVREILASVQRERLAGS